MYRKYKKDEFYTRKAHEEGYPARSVYKLKEIDEKFRIIKKGDRVLDLGASPGSWLKYIGIRVGRKGAVTGIDTEDIKIAPQPNMDFFKADLLANDIFSFKPLKRKYNVVVADLAPKTSGIEFLDVAKSLELASRSLEIAKTILEKGGSFVCKIFEGEGTTEFFEKTAALFKKTKRFRPKAVRREGREIYIIAKYFHTP